ncbi:zinc finger MYM-type protein 1-like [Chenopodium quinoa]|uniref:zinc finger MYM-type protein 1-like n=1 Tax=Chenopodium quinoa TaxID=63459 RepID=UPI000B7847FE|nr:zinc finger MYM-type protein 1-like [Chenopodium quinoa]
MGSPQSKGLASEKNKISPPSQENNQNLPPPQESNQNLHPPQESLQNPPPPQENEQIPLPHQASEQNSSPSHNFPKNQDEGACHGASSNPRNEAPIHEGRLSTFDIVNLPQDPGKRRKISDFHPDDRDLVRRTYIQRKPCQPEDFVFPQTPFGPKLRRFNKKWFDTWRTWLEYCVEKDAAFCFICYLFKKDNSSGGDAFVNEGFKASNRTEAFAKHVGGHMSAHNIAVVDMNSFVNQKASITTALSKQSQEAMSAYRKRLEASIVTTQWLLLQGFPFRGHDEKETSLNRGNFISLLSLLSKHDPNYSKVILKNSPSNCQLTSPPIQKNIINACAKETTKAILEELGDGFFAILADESADVTDKEQMAVCLRYVNKMGEICE